MEQSERTKNSDLSCSSWIWGRAVGTGQGFLTCSLALEESYLYQMISKASWERKWAWSSPPKFSYAKHANNVYYPKNLLSGLENVNNFFISSGTTFFFFLISWLFQRRNIKAQISHLRNGILGFNNLLEFYPGNFVITMTEGGLLRNGI